MPLMCLRTGRKMRLEDAQMSQMIITAVVCDVEILVKL